MSYHTSDLSLTSLSYGKSINQSSNHLTAWLRYSLSCFWFLAAECSPTWHNIQNKNYDFYLKLSDLFLSWSYTSAFNIHLVAQGGKKKPGYSLDSFWLYSFPSCSLHSSCTTFTLFHKTPNVFLSQGFRICCSFASSALLACSYHSWLLSSFCSQLKCHLPS